MKSGGGLACTKSQKRSQIDLTSGFIEWSWTIAKKEQRVDLEKETEKLAQ